MNQSPHDNSYCVLNQGVLTELTGSNMHVPALYATYHLRKTFRKQRLRSFGGSPACLPACSCTNLTNFSFSSCPMRSLDELHETPRKGTTITACRCTAKHLTQTNQAIYPFCGPEAISMSWFRSLRWDTQPCAKRCSHTALVIPLFQYWKYNRTLSTFEH